MKDEGYDEFGSSDIKYKVAGKGKLQEHRS